MGVARGRGLRRKDLRSGSIDRTLLVIAKLEVIMRYLTTALALAFAVGAVSAAQACPNNFETASNPSQIASTDQSAPPSTTIRIPTPPKG